MKDTDGPDAVPQGSVQRHVVLLPVLRSVHFPALHMPQSPVLEPPVATAERSGIEMITHHICVL